MSSDDRTEFIERARRDRRPLAGLDLTLPLEDLAPLEAIVGQARIVGIGESWHHAREILKLKFRISRFLIERLGFNTLAFEGSLAGSEKVDNYVRGSNTSVTDALWSFGQPMWLNPETVEFMRWLRAHNQTVGEARKVSVFGIDVGYPAAAIFAVSSYLARIDPSYSIPHRQLIDDIDQKLQSVQFGSMTKSAMHGSSDVYDNMSTASKETLRSAFVEILGRLNLCSAKYAFASSHAGFEQIRRYAILALQAHDVISVRSQNLGLANERRDAAFAENVVWIKDRVGLEARVVVLAHNLHISRGPFRSNPKGPDITSMGRLLSNWYANDYVAIGTAVGQGAMSGNDTGLVVSPQATDTAACAQFLGSTDGALEHVGSEHFLLEVKDESAWARQSHVLRCHFDPQPEYVLSDAFDALTYLDKITRAAPIAREEDAQ